MDAIKLIGDIKTGFLGTVTDDGTMDMYDGKARMMDVNGEYRDFDFKDYTDHIREHVEPWTYLKFPYDAKAGEFSMDLEKPNGIYRTNTLARINVCDKIKTPLANEELGIFRKEFGRPAQLSLLFHWARLIELLYNAEYTLQLLEDPEITSTDIRAKANPPGAARGVASVEAPRGTLIHDYETDDKGMIKNVNLIVGTTHNNAPINMSVKQTAKAVIKDGAYDEEKLNMLEMAIRAYDPCISCATHNLDGSVRIKVNVRNHKGKTVKVYKN
jgi:F420-non-reducing hydrogenase large subunit